MLSISSLLPVDQGICQYKTGHWLCCIKVGVVAHHDENCQPLGETRLVQQTWWAIVARTTS